MPWSGRCARPQQTARARRRRTACPARAAGRSGTPQTCRAQLRRQCPRLVGALWKHACKRLPPSGDAASLPWQVLCNIISYSLGINTLFGDTPRPAFNACNGFPLARTGATSSRRRGPSGPTARRSARCWSRLGLAAPPPARKTAESNPTHSPELRRSSAPAGSRSEMEIPDSTELE